MGEWEMGTGEGELLEVWLRSWGAQASWAGRRIGNERGEGTARRLAGGWFKGAREDLSWYLVCSDLVVDVDPFNIARGLPLQVTTSSCALHLGPGVVYSRRCLACSEVTWETVITWSG